LGRAEIPQISEAIGLTPDETSDLIAILDDDGAIEANWTFGGGAAPKLTGRGKLKLARLPESSREEDAQMHPPSDSESSPEPQEFQPNPDYSVVIWRGKEYFLSPRQAECVRLLHKAHTDGTRWLRGQDILKIVAPSPKGIVSIRLSDVFKNSPAWDEGLVDGNRRNFYRLNL
jgi:hypothetical protein